MFIEQGYFVKNLYLYQRKSPITYTYGGTHSVKVSLKQGSKKKSPHKKNNDFSICKARGSFKSSEKIKQYFINISNNELPNEMIKNAEALKYLNNTAKTVERMHIDYFPQSFKDYVRNVKSELHDIIKRTVDIFMWRCGIPGNHNPLSNGGMSFSLDGKKWNMIPNDFKIHFGGMSIPQPPKRISLSLKKLINNIHDQPVGHKLFREAQFLQNTNPQISIVVAISALEVAVKECISRLNPDSNWLVENLPSPDVRKLLNKYIPKLLCNTPFEKVLPLPDFLDKATQKGVYIRNKVVHIGSGGPSRDSTEKILSSVQDIIWLLDFCTGHDWAINYVSTDAENHIKANMK